MTRLNDVAAEMALAASATGLGLLGHLGRMGQESGVDQFEPDADPYGVDDYVGPLGDTCR